MMNTLIIIPARKGSKGIPGKNIMLLKGKPLISHTLDFALMNKGKEDTICVSTDDEKIIKLFSKERDIEILKRPKKLCQDNSGMSEVLGHALKFYEEKEIFFKHILLLQPTSPLRSPKDYNNLISSSKKNFDMIVSVCEADENPYFNLYEENNLGFLSRSKDSNFVTRQECPKIFKFNGAFYLIKVKAFKEHGLHGIRKISKIIMPKERSIDIDTEYDMKLAEFLLK
jgi:CMP-N,N'-diacetyllegionaminic acid synthase